MCPAAWRGVNHAAWGWQDGVYKITSTHTISEVYGMKTPNPVVVYIFNNNRRTKYTERWTDKQDHFQVFPQAYMKEKCNLTTISASIDQHTEKPRYWKQFYQSNQCPPAIFLSAFLHRQLAGKGSWQNGQVNRYFSNRSLLLQARRLPLQRQLHWDVRTKAVELLFKFFSIFIFSFV